MKYRRLITPLLSILLLNGFAAQSAPGKLVPPRLDKRLRSYIFQTNYLRIYGSGPMWKKATSLDEHTGFEVRDKRLLNFLWKMLYSTKQTSDENVAPDPDYRDQHYLGSISVDFVPIHGKSLSSIGFTYERRGIVSQPEELTDLPDKRMLSMRLGYDMRFEALVQSMATRARWHDRLIRYIDTTTAS